MISAAKIAILFHTAKGLAEKNGSGKAARLQGCKLHDVFFGGEMSGIGGDIVRW